MRLQVGGARDDVGRPDEPPDPPAGHRVRLGDAVDDDARVGQLRDDDRHRGVHRVAVDEVLVDLVRDDPDAVLDGPAPDGLDLRGRRDGTGGIGRRAPDQRLGARRAGGLELLDRDPVALVLGRHDVDRHATGKLDRLGVGGPVRRREQDLVAGVEDRGEGGVDRLLAAVGDQDLAGVDGPAAVPSRLAGDRGLELKQATRRGVAVVGRVLARRDCRGHDRCRCWEVRLTGPEADDVLAGGLLGFGLRVHRKRRGLRDATDAGRDAADRGRGSTHSPILPGSSSGDRAGRLGLRARRRTLAPWALDVSALARPRTSAKVWVPEGV